MYRSPIEWVKNPDGTQGYGLNPMTGCTNHVEGLCNGGQFPCFAYRTANGRVKNLYLDNPNVAIPAHLEGQDLHSEDVAEQHQDPFYPRFWPDRLAELTRRNDFLWADDIGRGRKAPKGGALQYVEPKGIFLCDMADPFGNDVPEDWTTKILDEIWGNKGVDTFYMLTKQPQNLLKFSPFPDNLWIGVTVCNGRMWYQACKYLQQVSAFHKFMSFEPLLGCISNYRPSGEVEEITSEHFSQMVQSFLNWAIIGSWQGTWEEYNRTNFCFRKGLKPMQRGRMLTVQPDIEWVRKIITLCDNAGIPVFMKDNLFPLIHKERTVADRKLFGRDNALRQELPKATCSKGERG